MSPQLPEPSGLLVYGFLTIQLTMAVGLLYCIVRTSGTKALPKAAALLVAWLGLTAGLASTGMLDTWAPPPMLLILLSMVGYLAWSSRQPWTAKLAELPLSFLVGFQGFRIVVEILIHIAVQEGIAHPTMTWSGTNWDLVAGVTAVLLAPFAKRSRPSGASDMECLDGTCVNGDCGYGLCWLLPSRFARSWESLPIPG